MAIILVVDDEESLRMFLRGILEDAGHLVFEASDGKECLKSVRTIIPDILMLDVFMPEMDGFETVSALREKNQQLKIIAMSGGGSMGSLDVLKIIKLLGANTSISKPFTAQHVVEVINTVLS